MSLKADSEERDKQIVATLLKEAEFLRNEILLSMTASRNVLISTATFIGVLMTATGGILAFKASENGVPLKKLIMTNRWSLWAIAVVGILTCVTFLRLYLGSLAGIWKAARYYRERLQPRLNEILDTTSNPILYWENWLTEMVQKRNLGCRHLAKIL